MKNPQHDNTSRNTEEKEANRATSDKSQKETSETNRSPFDVIQQVLWLLTQSPKHKFMFLADIEWYFLPAFRLG